MTEDQGSWIVRRNDDSKEMGRYPTKAEAWAWVHARTMPWEFDVYSEVEDVVNNISQAIEWSNRLSDLQLVRTTLIGIFARRELEGGRAAALEHPLMKRIEIERLVLEEQILLLV